MSTVQGSLAAEERLRWLTEQLAVEGFVAISAASSKLDVSEMTIRRDLVELEGRGTARRVRGGAKAVGPLTFDERRDTATRAKSRIARKLAGLVPATGAVAFDASSTVMRVASSLQSAAVAPRDLMILTNGRETFQALQGVSGVTALLTGGRLDSRTGSLVGPLACRAAAQLTVQVFFASAAAVDPTGGAFEMALEEAEVKRTIAAGADEVVLAVDGSKLAGRALAVAVEWDQVDLLVTDLDPGDERLAPYRGLAELL